MPISYCSSCTYPITYNISQGATATEVVAEMVKRTVSRLKNAGVAEADYETVLIKASIVEREATPTYYGQVARVIDNRLADTDGDTQGKLGMDSTILYGLGRSGGMPTQAELDDASNPYNTRIVWRTSSWTFLVLSLCPSSGRTCTPPRSSPTSWPVSRTGRPSARCPGSRGWGPSAAARTTRA